LALWSSEREVIVNKKIICIDFDGVLHSYKRGWMGACRILDPPVAGDSIWSNAIDWLGDMIAYPEFDICIFSSRSRYFSGRQAMKKWLRKSGLCKEALEKLRFPKEKPPAFVTIDDRAIVFRGEFPTVANILDFKPWNK